jgi:ribosomal-protein-alanine N-acetyltransferase
MMIVSTPRVLIRPLVLTDAAFIIELLNTPSWLKYIGERHVHSEAKARQYIQRQLDSYEKLGFGLYAMCRRETGEAIGLCGFLQRTYLPSPDLGFAILPEMEGQGYTREACTELLKYARTTLNITTILAITTLDNDRSQHVLGNLGFAFSGIIEPEGASQFKLFELK